MSTQDTLADRYGRKTTPASPKKKTVVISLISAIMAGLILWWGTANDILGAGPNASFRDTGFQDLTDSSITVNFELTATEGEEVACAIQAQNPQFAIVGWKVVIYPPSDIRIRSLSETLITSEPATTGLVAYCWLT